MPQGIPQININLVDIPKSKLRNFTHHVNLLNDADKVIVQRTAILKSMIKKLLEREVQDPITGYQVMIALKAPYYSSAVYSGTDWTVYIDKYTISGV